MMVEQELISKYLIHWIEDKWMPPLKLDIFPTDLCNANCKFCWQRAPGANLALKSHELSDERLLELVKEGASLGVKRWEFSGGGEPFRRKDIVLEMIEEIKAYKMQVGIITNGLLLNSSIIERLIDLKCDELIISLDGPNEEINDFIRPPKGSFKKITEVLLNLEKMKKDRKKSKPKVKLNCVISKVNLEYIQDMVEFTVKYNLDGITFDLLQDLSSECNKFMISSQREREVLDLQILSALNIANQYNLETNLSRFLSQSNTKQILSKKNEILLSENTRYSLLNAHCFEPWYRMYIHVAGNVSPCCAVPIFKDNIKHKTLKEVWLGQEFAEFRNKILTNNLPENCKICGASFSSHSNTIRYYLRKKMPLIKKRGTLDKKNKFYILREEKHNGLNVCLVSREYPQETGWGGIGSYTYHLAHGLVKQGHKVHVISQSLTFDKEYNDDGVYVHRIGHPHIFIYKKPFEELARRIEYSWKVYQKIKQIHRKEKLDIVEGPNYTAECFIYSLFKKTPLVTRIHTPYSEVVNNFGWDWTWDRKISSWMENVLLYRSDMVTSSTKVPFKQTDGWMKGKSKIIPLGIDLPEYNDLNDSINEHPLILFVGRLEKRKGVHVLMKAVPEILKVIPDANFVLIGRDCFFQEDETSFGNPEGRNFKDTFWDKLPVNFKSKVYLLGYVDEDVRDKYYQKCDIFVAPSLHETFGFVYLEAMSYGKPVIGCNVGGVPEVIKDKQVGFLIRPEDPDALAKAIIKLAKNKGLRERMGRKARKYVEQKFTVKRLVSNTIENYNKIISLSKK